MPLRESRPPSVGTFAPSVDAVRASPLGKPWPERSALLAVPHSNDHGADHGPLGFALLTLCSVTFRWAPSRCLLRSFDLSLAVIVCERLTAPECNMLASLYNSFDTAWCRLCTPDGNDNDAHHHRHARVSLAHSLAHTLDSALGWNSSSQPHSTSVTVNETGNGVPRHRLESLLTKREVARHFGNNKRKRSFASRAALARISGPLALLHSEIAESLLRITRCVLLTCGYLPEEAASLLRLDWRKLEFPFLKHTISFEHSHHLHHDSHPGVNRSVLSVSSATNAVELIAQSKGVEDCTEEGDALQSALDLSDRLSTALCDGCRPDAMSALHLASDALITNLDRSNGSWSRRVHARTLMRGITVLEREREYDTALHYLTILSNARDAMTPSLAGDVLHRFAVDTAHAGDCGGALSLAERAVAGDHGQISRQSRLRLEKLIAKFAVPPRRWKKPKVTQLRSVPSHDLVLQTTDDGSWITGSVEGAVLDAYKRSGWEGLHSENGPWLALVPLLFMDALFGNANALQDEPPLGDAPHWMTPLSTFAHNSMPPTVTQRAEQLARMNPDELASAVNKALAAHKHKPFVMRGLPLEGAGLECLGDIAMCFGGEVISSMSTMILRDWESHAGGMPDLIVYDTRAMKARAIEVKGPGDSISEKQSATLDELIKAGADARVCNAKAK